MKSIIFILYLFLVPTVLFAQINKGAFDDYLYFVNQNRPAYEDIQGTPYLSEDFIPARIDNFKNVVQVKFNVFANNIEFKKPDNDIAILSLEKDYKFRLLDSFNTEYEIHDYVNEKDELGRTFFKKIGSGENFTLFLKQNIKLIPKKLATSGFEQNQPARFSHTKGTFYVGHPQKDIKKLVAVPTRKKEITTFFKEKSKLIKQYMKKERLKLDNEDDLMELLNYYWD